jgi:hypothetical protein
VVWEVCEVGVGAADLTLQAGAGNFERAVGVTRLEAHDLAIGEATVFGLEFAIDQTVRRAEVVAVAGLGNDRDLELGAVAEIMVPW